MTEALVEHFRCPASLAPPALSGSSQSVDDYRRERYPAARRGRETACSALRRAYYRVRPLLALPVRKRLQRLSLSGWETTDFPAWPVDTTVERLMAALLRAALQDRHLDRIPFIWFWPDAAPASIIITHDVQTAAGIRFCPRLMDLDQEFAVSSSFELIPEGSYAVSAALLDEISRRGFEINVRDLALDGNLFHDRQSFLESAHRINQHIFQWRAFGFRAGRMYRNLDWLDALDISYDMSVPNAAHLDAQRGGCCTVFPYFLGRILELPLTTIQDYALLHILGDYSTELWKTQTSLILEQHGLASFLVHPDYIRQPDALEVYRSLLDYLSALRDEEGVWIARPMEVNHWWRQRSQMSLVLKGSGWRIEGPGRERARVAWASLEGDRLVYAVDGRAELVSCPS